VAGHGGKNWLSEPEQSSLVRSQAAGA